MHRCVYESMPALLLGRALHAFDSRDCTFPISQSAFPHDTDQLVQTEITPLRDIAINTDMPSLPLSLSLPHFKFALAPSLFFAHARPRGRPWARTPAAPAMSAHAMDQPVDVVCHAAENSKEN